MKKHTLLSMGCLTPIAFALAGVVHAQDMGDRTDKDNLETITVTAEKMAKSLQKTSIAVSTISGEEALNKGLVSMGDMVKDMIGVNIQDVGDGAAVNIRGMGWDMPVDVGENATSVNYDGAFNSSAQAAIFGFYDLDRMEVLRGPQGTLYGRNATAGVVNVLTKNPDTEEVEGYIVAEAGNYSHTRLEGALNIPLSDTMAARVAFSDIDRDGYMSTGSGDVDGTAVRAKFAYLPNDDTSLVISAERIEMGGISPDINTPAASFDAGDIYFSSRVVPEQEYRFDVDRYTVNFDTTVGPGVLSLIGAYSSSERGGTIFLPFLPVPLTDYGSDELTQQSAEVRYSSLADARVQWQVGLYYYDREQDQAVSAGTCAGAGCLRGAGSTAIYGQVTYPISDTFRAIVGGRYSSEDASLIQRNDPAESPFADASTTFDNFTWKLGLEKDYSDELMGYATLATSTRPGGFNTGVNIDSSTFDEEEVTSLEFGMKSRWLSNNLQVNGALFWYDYDNYQTVDAAGDPFLDPANFYVQFFNAATARIRGLEVETIALLSSTTRVNFGFAYLDAEYTSEFELHLTPFDPPTNLQNAALPRSPKLTVKANIDQDFYIGDAGVITATAGLRWLDDHKGAALETPNTLIDSYYVIDLSANYTPNVGNWSINLWVRNASEEVYKMGASTGDVQAGAPRMYGANFRYNF
ncbi:hypothetical protein FJ444_04430 [Aestuariibacter sp. GS-14]|uniref:TonB-dependent receptor n=1 Tax=Aestuariibacter sp. GS-14 TaxID=2590670 RepID=UPI0011279730|nr:TonB-dependent receptor [Aestuariibacter sp. GS-14]TPV60873.1 hypothetical protein FJ444_04430 [Aestuariibacter sp. GS-14]